MVNRRSPQRERWGWYLYDFGNSAYAAVVLLAVYSAYFKGTVVGGAQGSRLWGISVGIAMLFVAVTSPVLGALADFSGAKKRFLLFFTSLAITFCALLFFVREGHWFLGMLFFILAEIGYRSAQVFYNALLPEIAEPEDMGRVSGNGWAIGSAGGILCLVIVLVPIVLTGSDPLVVRLSLVFTAVFFAVSALPTFFWVQERTESHPLPTGRNYFSVAFQRLAETARTIKKFKEFVKFIIAFQIYKHGVYIVLNFAAILGAVLFGMEQQELIIFMILVQVTSVAGAYLCGLLVDAVGTKHSLIVSLMLLILPVVWLYFSRSRFEFYLIGAVAGFSLTGIQSVSRTAVGMFAPPGKSAEFYGFFAMTGRTSSFIGPTLFGLLVAWTTQWYETAHQMGPIAAEEAGHRLALVSVVAFLTMGLLLLLLVDEKKGREAGAG
ncbi:MAG: MFS transporter [Anaerolineales bacterium]